MLIHEVDKVLYTDLKLAFGRVGFFKANVLKGDPQKAAGYVGKYMTKDETHARVRASFQYGDTDTHEPTECLDFTSTNGELAQNPAPNTSPIATARGGQVFDPTPPSDNTHV